MHVLGRWLQLVLSVVSGPSLQRLQLLWSAAFAAVALVVANPVSAGAYLGEPTLLSACLTDGDDGETADSPGPAERRHRVVSPVRALTDCESSAITDFAEEIEVETLPAAGRVERLGEPTCPARELSERRNSYAAVELVEWLREHHAPRGPPAL